MKQSTQHLLDAIRRPRVHVTYDVEIGDAVESRELPYVLGVMADLSGHSKVNRAPLKERKFTRVSGSNLNDIMASIKPRVAIRVKDVVRGGNALLNIDLTFTNINHFEPQYIVDNVDILQKLMASRTRLNDLVGKLDSNEELNRILDEAAEKKDKKIAPEKVVEDTKMVREESQKEYARSLIKEFIDQMDKVEGTTQDSVDLANKRIAAIDAVISEQLDQILHHPDFQRLEASWRGLWYLLTNIDVSARIQVRLLNITKDELRYDLEKAAEFDQSKLFKKIYEEEYGTFGGSPYSCLMGDFEFGRTQADLALLVKIAQIASAAHAPFLAGANPTLFDMDSFTELGIPRDLSIIFENTELGKWQSFRESEDSRYVALTLPHILIRAPYGKDSNPCPGVSYEENVDGHDNSMFCWANAAWSIAQRVMHSAMLYGWPAAIRGVEGGGLVEDLPYYTFKSTDGDVALKCPTEVAISDRREKELSDLGFLPLCHCKNRDYAAFFGSQTAQKPKHYSLPEANANAALSSRLSYILAASRFAHYIKAIMRDKIGSFMSYGDVERYMNNWISQYVLLSDYADQESKAKFPLREARVDVVEVPGKPGSYKATVFIRPHFQLEELTASIRLVADLPRPAYK